MTAEPLLGDRVRLQPVRDGDVRRLREIRRSPVVVRWWGQPDDPSWPLGDSVTQFRGVWVGGDLVGFVQWYEEDDPRYRHAGIDLFLAEEVQGQGLGREVVAVVLAHLVSVGHHRVVIDPAADNEAAISCYSACGFTPVGVMRRYERDADGDGWHDGLLMEYVVHE